MRTLLSGKRPLITDLLVFAAVAVLLFTSLDGSLLWSDEAETALLGRNILEYGLPLAFDGTNIVSSELGREFGADFIFRWSSWGDKYAAALSMYLFGETTTGARLIFTAAAFASAVVFHLAMMRVFPERYQARLATIFYSSSIPFILHARQSRYYGLAMLWTTLSIYILLRPRRTFRHWAAFAFVALLMFHTNYMLAIASLAAFLSAVLLTRLKRPFPIREFILGIGAAFAVSLPGLLLYRTGGISDRSLVESFPANIGYYLLEINDYSYPGLLALAVGAALLMRKRRSAIPAGRTMGLRGLLFLGTAFAASYVVILSFAPFSFFRYLVPLLPVFAALLSASVALVSGRSILAAAAVSAVLVLTNIVHVLPRLAFAEGPKAAVRSYLYEHAQELAHPVRGPIRALVEYLNEHADDGDVVLITYGDLPLKFYTGLEVHGGLAGEDLGRLDLKRVKWIVARRHVITMQPGKDYSVHQFIERSFSPDDFEAIELDAPDTPFENREDPGEHLFRSPAGVPPVTIFRRVEGR